MPLPTVRPTSGELLRWNRVKPVLLLAAEVVDAGSSANAVQERLASMIAELTGGPLDLATDWYAVACAAVDSAAEGIATPLDYSDPPTEAVLAWREYLRRGGSVRSLGSYLSRGSSRLVKVWTAPEKTVRERMWLANDLLPSRQLTLRAWPGIQRVLVQCEDVLGITLPAALPELQREPRTLDQSYPIPGDRSDFVCDVTVADGTEFDQGEEFVKTWRIRNSGSVPWLNRFLARQGGATGPGSHSSPSRVLIPDVEPGSSIDISVVMRAALLPGTSASTWKMVDIDGCLFYPDRYRHGLRCEIVTRGRH